MRITVRLFGSIASILTDFPGNMALDIDEPMPVWQLLGLLNIDPLLVMMVTVNDHQESKDYIVRDDSELVLYGPISGG